MLVIDKPAGMSSHDVVGRVRHLLQHRRVGHAGTLDPFATGVLLVCVGRGTRLVPWLMGAQKTYVAQLRFGWRSTTQDTEGDLTQSETPLPTRETLEKILPSFTGNIKQRPPAHSAVRINGRRAYKIARSGREVEMPERPVQIDALRVLKVIEDKGHLLEASVEIVCGSGTYIRSLARDIGEALGCGAYLTELRRTAVAPYSLEQALPFFKDKTLNDPQKTQAHLLPVGQVKIALPSLPLDVVEATRFLQGQRIAGRPEPDIEEMAIHNPDGILLGVAALREGVLHPLVVLG